MGRICDTKLLRPFLRPHVDARRFGATPAGPCRAVGRLQRHMLSETLSLRLASHMHMYRKHITTQCTSDRLPAETTAALCTNDLVATVFAAQHL